MQSTQRIATTEERKETEVPQTQTAEAPDETLHRIKQNTRLAFTDLTAGKMLMAEPATAVRFSGGSLGPTSRLLSHSGSFFIHWNKFRRLTDDSCMRRINLVKKKVSASAEKHSGPLEQNPKPSRYHPFEDISDSESMEGGETRLTPAETTRTIIEVNNKTTLMFSGFVHDEVHENIFWPDLPYVTDEHGNIYFQVKNDEDILQTLTSEENFVQVIIGLDTTEMISEMELLGRSDIDFGVEEIDDDDDDGDDGSDDDSSDEDDEDDNFEKDWVTLLEDEEDGDSDQSLGDWAKLETMRSSHPMYFAKKLAEVVSDVPIDFMDQPPAGLAIQGLIRPAFIEEHSVIQKHLSDHQSSNADTTQDKVEDLGIINGHIHEPGPSQDTSIWAEELEKDESLRNGTSYYKLEMTKIQLVSAHGYQTVVELEDFRNARPDAIAHSAAKIITRLKAGGEKTMQALKSFCWRCKGIQVEEVAVIGIDTLGFDLRVCSGTQVQTLRFAFSKRASSEYSAERQLNNMLFPRTSHKIQKKKEARQTEL